MLIPLSWVREYAPIDDEGAEPAEVARRLTAAGLEVESATPRGARRPRRGRRRGAGDRGADRVQEADQVRPGDGGESRRQRTR